MEIIDYPSPNFFESDESIAAIVLHGTAGPLRASLATLTNARPDNPGKAVSSNYLIDTNGDIYRLVPWWLDRRAWANGVLNKPDRTVNWLNNAIRNRVNPNLKTVSIEHVASDTAMKNHGRLTDKQWRSSYDLVKQLLKEFHLEANHETVMGHYQFDSVNKSFCPGVIDIPAYINALNNIY